MKKDVKLKNLIASLYDLSLLVRQKTTEPETELAKSRLLIQRVFSFDLLSVFQYDFLENKLVPQHLYGEIYNLVDAVNFRLGKGATGWSYQKGKSLLIKKMERQGEAQRFFVNSFLAVPIIINDEKIGAVAMGSFRSDVYNNGDRYLMEILAPYLGMMLIKPNFPAASAAPVTENQEERM